MPNKKKDVRPLWATTVSPQEYDVDAQMKAFIEAANDDKECFYPIDTGKLWGLYLEYKKLHAELTWAWENMTYTSTNPREGEEFDFCNVCNEPEREHKPDCQALAHKAEVESILGRRFHK